MTRLSPDSQPDDPGPSARSATFTRRAALIGALQALGWLAACSLPSLAPNGEVPAAQPSATPTLQPSPTPTFEPAATALASLPSCAARQMPVIAPTPVPYPGYTQMEMSTHLHVTGEAQIVDPASYRLEVTGKVDHPLSLTFDELRCLPKVGDYVRLECPGFFIDWTNLAGVPLFYLLEMAVPQKDVQLVDLASIDKHSSRFSLAEAQAPENFLAYEWEGQWLPPSHGFPLRAVLPGRIGGEWTKWLTTITLS
jgi:DMSO/TMAO reductase YedYZ molybdopterin-dependent catalytic subunit